MDHTFRSIDDCAENNVDEDGHTQVVSEGKNISKWPRDFSCDIWAKNVVAFCPCLKELPETKWKSFGFQNWQRRIQALMVSCGS